MLRGSLKIGSATTLAIHRLESWQKSMIQMTRSFKESTASTKWRVSLLLSSSIIALMPNVDSRVSAVIVASTD